MRLAIFPRRSVKAYCIVVLIFAAWLALGRLTENPEWECHCAEAEPGTAEHAEQQRYLASVEAQLPGEAAVVFVVTLLSGGALLGLMTATGIALRGVLGPYK